MIYLRPLDPVVPIEKQLQSTATRVVLVNLFGKVAVPNLCAA